VDEEICMLYVEIAMVKMAYGKAIGDDEMLI
jgi:hypothetical protein